MGNISHYWEDKESRKILADKHTKLMHVMYEDEIQKCIDNTTVYSNKIKTKFTNDTKVPITLIDLDTVSAADQFKEGKTAMLNFASYKNPGGGFLKGSKAQEECLCHSSYLYNILSSFEEYYGWNNEHLNKALYTNRALYTPNVRFKFGFCDVITCASPNFTTAKKYQGISAETNNKVLKDRIKFVLDVAATNKVETLILGAFGCGVFGQNPTVVCQYFAEMIQNYPFKHVIFAIPTGKYDRNFEAFKTELERLKNE